MVDIIKIDIFDAGGELIVIPISTEGTISPTFQSGLESNGIFIPLRKNNYGLGETEVRRVAKHKSIKYLVFACSVKGQTSNYAALSKICLNIAEATKKASMVKSIAMPLLGTGAGRLDHSKSLLTLFESFYKHARAGVNLVFCIPDENTYVSLRNSLFFPNGVSLLRVKQLIITNQKNKAKKLDLGNCGLTTLDIIPELFSCTHIEELILSNEWGVYENGHITRKKSINKGIGNVFSSIPNEMKYLKNLKILICGGDWRIRKKADKVDQTWSIKDISVISNLPKLTMLNVSNNKVEKVGKINSLLNLQNIYLNNNRLASFPKITNLNSLKELYLSNNNLYSVAFLEDSLSIKTLDLHSNPITDIRPLRNLISKIGIVDSKWTRNTICISSAPLKIPRPEIISQGKDKVIAYFNQLQAEQRIRLKPFINKDIKLILVGNSNVGKSTLLCWLKNKKVKKDVLSTHWLDVEKWQPKHSEGDLVVRVFDFGGQEYYHDTHHLFFTDQTVFIVLWDKKADRYEEIEVEQKQIDGRLKKVMVQTYPLNYWLDSIDFYTKRKKKTNSEREFELLFDTDEEYEDSKRIIEYGLDIKLVSTERKGGFVSARQENILIVQNKVDSVYNKDFIDQKSLKEKHSNIVDFLSVSVFEETGLNVLEDLLFQIFKLLPIFGKPCLGTWGIIKTKIEDEEFTSPYTLSDFHEYCNNIIKEIPEVIDKSTDQVNEVLFSAEDSESFAQFLNDIGILLFFPEIENIKDKVFLNQKQILDNIYKILFGLEVLQGEFDITKVTKNLNKERVDDEVSDTINLMLHFKIIFEHPAKADTYIAPLYLPKEPLHSIKIFSSLFKKPLYRYKYKAFIHKNVILDFFHHYGKQALKETSNNLYYYWKDGIIVKDDLSNEIIMVKFHEPGNESQCACVDVYSILNSKDETYLKKIACDLEMINDGWGVVKTVSNDGEHFIPIDIIHKNEKENNWVFHYDEKIYKLTDFKKYLNMPLKMKKVFISYSKSDNAHLTKLENHLSILKRNGTIDTWNCRKLLPGEKWDGKIKKELEEADLILFLVSDDFLATDYIWDVEIKRAIERENDPNDSARVVPIIVRACVWEDSPLGIYNTAPKKAEVINSADDIDEAWTRVVKELKQIL